MEEGPGRRVCGRPRDSRRGSQVYLETSRDKQGGGPRTSETRETIPVRVWSRGFLCLHGPGTPRNLVSTPLVPSPVPSNVPGPLPSTRHLLTRHPTRPSSLVGPGSRRGRLQDPTSSTSSESWHRPKILRHRLRSSDPGRGVHRQNEGPVHPGPYPNYPNVPLHHVCPFPDVSPSLLDGPGTNVGRHASSDP